jgi:large subunit ribosomal protein L28
MAVVRAPKRRRHLEANAAAETAAPERQESEPFKTLEAFPGDRYTAASMSKVCAICGKRPSFGHNRSHSMVATKRRFDPNLQRVRVLLRGKPTRAYVCTRCLKSGKVEKAI